MVPASKRNITFVLCSFTLSWLLCSVLSSSVAVRKLLAGPLVVHNDNARGNACYVMAGGGSLPERLAAGADLVQMGRVGTLYVMEDNSKGSYSFKAKRSLTRTEWAIDYLTWRGVPRERIVALRHIGGLFGTLKEARNVTELLPPDVKTLVLVSSAPHMRRSVLAFKRSLPVTVRVEPYAATDLINSYELYQPLWIEYLKLLVYFVIA